MKIQAKDLQTGMTVYEGTWSNKIESIETAFQKNGTPTVTIKGKDNDSRKDKYGKSRGETIQSRVYKHLTFVTVK
jgi:hypothetical protein